MFHFEDAMYRLATFWLKTWLEPNWQAGTFLFSQGSDPCVGMDDEPTVIHTNLPTLAPANWLDFRAYMSDLARQGRQDELWSIWSRVAEITHLPAPSPSITDFDFLGSKVPVRRIVCTQAGCDRCGRARGGYQFPFLGPWSKSAAIVEEPELGPAVAFAAYDRCREVLAEDRLWDASSGLELQDMLTATFARVLYQAEINDLHGADHPSVDDVFRAWRTWQQGQRAWRDPLLLPEPTPNQARANEVHKAHRSMLLWLRWAADPAGRSMPAVCVDCGGSGDFVHQILQSAMCRDCLQARVAMASRPLSDSGSGSESD